MESLVQRLVENPQDQEAITYAHQAGLSDPRSYAMLLEKVGTASSDPALASHWLTEAANVWAGTLDDAHRAARALMIAIDRDPTQSVPADRLAELYREKGDNKALVALLERRAKALAPHLEQQPELATQLAVLHEELGRLWSDPPLSQSKKAIDNYRRAIQYDPTSQFAIYAVRELYKSIGHWLEAIPYFDLEQQLIPDDLERQLALYQDEAEVRRNAGDLPGASAVLRSALLREGGQDATLKQLLGAAVLERVQAGESVHESERAEAVQLFVELAEQFPGEYGYSYALCALEMAPAHDRAMQLTLYYAAELARDEEVAPKAAAYLKLNPQGAVAAQAQEVASRYTGAFPTETPAEPPAAAAAQPDERGRVKTLLESAEALSRRGKKNDAAAAYRAVLDIDAAEPEALGFMETYLRQTRKYAELRDVLLAASRRPGTDTDARVGWLREIASLCEAQLRDIDGAIAAWKQLVSAHPEDENARGQLRRLLERAGKWDDLAALMERDAEQHTDLTERIALEKALAKLHEQKRRDPVATGEVWARIAQLCPDDETAIWTAVKHFEKAQRHDLAADALAAGAASLKDDRARIQLYRKLGELRHKASEYRAAGEAFAQAAELANEAVLWESAEQCFAAGEAWAEAAKSAISRASLVGKRPERAGLYARAAQYLSRTNDAAGALARLEEASELDPVSSEYARELEARYTEAGRLADLAAFLQKRADKLPSMPERLELRKRAAALLQGPLEDREGARECLRRLVQEQDDAEALAELADDAEQRESFDEAVDYLRRLLALVTDRAEKARLLQREAQILSSGLEDANGAIQRYEELLREYDPTSLTALRSIAELSEKTGDREGVARALERHLAVVQDLEVARRLADLYEHELERSEDAVRILDIVRELDEEDFEALERVCRLREELEDWPRVAEHLTALIEIEADDEDVSRMTRRLAEILHMKLGKADEALALLLEAGDRGDELARNEYVRLGDELGWKGIVATKLVDWYLEFAPGKQHQMALRGAFDRFLEVGREVDAASVAKELARTRAADADFARQLEGIAVRLRDVDALGIAHDISVQELSGRARAEEMVRQAEVLVEAGVEPEEALQHGEQALTSVPPGEVEPLLSRLAQLATAANQVVSLYERQVTRCKSPDDRLRALARAAEVAGDYADWTRARALLDLALSGAITAETLAVLEEGASRGDDSREKPELTRVLSEAMAAGGQGFRDGGRTRSALLRRAAKLAHEKLENDERAFAWLGDALITYVDDAGLDALEGLAQAVGTPERIEAVLSRALEEVFDGPLVRKLLARRASVRRDRLDDKSGAAQDLKKLHDLAPADLKVMEELRDLYTELGDYRGMVQLYEDQILRGKDPASRAELARKVARLWEEELDDAREAADAWRRVLRMKSADPEASEGLERAKLRMLQRSAAKSETEERPREPASSAVQVLPERAPDIDRTGDRDSGIRDHADLGYTDDRYTGEEEITKTASLRELEERSIASSPRPVQLTPVPPQRDDDDADEDELQVDEQDLFEEDERR